MGSELGKKSKIVSLKGPINENFPASTLLALPAPLKLNFKEVDSVNSIGVREFIRFMAAWGDNPIEFYSLSPEFVEAANVFAGMLGSPPNKRIVKSVELQFQCDICDIVGFESLEFSTWDVEEEIAKIIHPACETCGDVMELPESAYGILLFLHA